jgi:hypothetical protein
MELSAVMMLKVGGGFAFNAIAAISFRHRQAAIKRRYLF